MAKKESTFLNMVSTLMVVTLVAAGLLGSVYALTKTPATEDSWRAALERIRARERAPGLIQAWRAHEAWWAEFWTV